jgi:predicted kinase
MLRGCWISRDSIRFSMVNENEDYFSKEKAVFKEFTKQISEALEEYDIVIADATHITKRSRAKILNALTVKPDKIKIFWVDTPLEECIKRNEQRIGTRAYVPNTAIRNMFNSLEPPTKEEGFDSITIL